MHRKKLLKSGVKLCISVRNHVAGRMFMEVDILCTSGKGTYVPLTITMIDQPSEQGKFGPVLNSKSIEEEEHG